jgi:PAS domain S-box-containing protein
MAAESRLILVVEDEPGTATLQRRRLERAGFRVAVAGDVDAAMYVLAREAVDLVVMDYRLGTSTGLDLNRRVKAAGLDVPVIIVSGSIDDASIIEAMRAGVKDVLVKGSDYLDRLPAAVHGVLEQAARVPERVPPAELGTRVLIVEDDEGVAALERRELERAGYETTVASSADEALVALRTGRVNLAIVDLRLDGAVSGLDLYEQVKADGRDVPVILVTAFGDQAVAIRALRAGVRDFVPKAGEFLEYLTAAVDRVVEQVRVERKLVESELRLASIIGTAMDAIAMCDDRLRIVLFNRSAEEMFGCAASDAIGRPLTTLIPEIDRAVFEDVPGGTRGVVQKRLEVEGTHVHGARIPIEVSISDVVVHGRRLFTVIARDVSERRRTEAELREADRRKDEFLGMLAHELRNPLAAISTAGEVLHRTLEQPAAQKLTGVIRRQTAALARMVDDLLDVSRVTLGKIQLEREPLLVSEVVARAVESAREPANRGELDLRLHAGAEPVWLHGDAARLEQVLANLLNNAVKFTPRGGRIDVSAGREGGQAVIRVSDTGAGIDAALLPRVFDLFVQGDTSLDRAKSGLGIGLALVRQVVTMHGGQVSADSDGPGRGSEFVVRLPASLDEVPSDEAPAPAPASADRPLRVLVVDDQRDLADCVALLVEALGHRARAVYDGSDALEAGRAYAPDLMLVDIGMPGMTGYELARAVRRDPVLSRVRLVALTGYGRQEDRARVHDAGFDLHLTKPVADATLREVLDACEPSEFE